MLSLARPLVAKLSVIARSHVRLGGIVRTPVHDPIDVVSVHEEHVVSELVHRDFERQLLRSLAGGIVVRLLDAADAIRRGLDGGNEEP